MDGQSSVQQQFFPALITNHFEQRVRTKAPDMGWWGGHIVQHYLISDNGDVHALESTKMADGSRYYSGERRAFSRVVNVYNRVYLGNCGTTHETDDVLKTLYRHAGLDVSVHTNDPGKSKFYQDMTDASRVMDNKKAYHFSLEMVNAVSKIFDKSSTMVQCEKMPTTSCYAVSLKVGYGSNKSVVKRLDGFNEKSRSLSEAIDRMMVGRP